MVRDNSLPSGRKCPRRLKRISRRKVNATRVWKLHSDVLEDVAAISESFHQEERYKKFYHRYCEQLSGFSGIWTFIAFAGTRFNRAAPEWEGDGWISCVGKFVEAIYDESMGEGYQDNMQSKKWLDPIVRKVFRDAMNDERALQTRHQEIH